MMRADWAVNHLPKDWKWPGKKDPSIPEGTVVSLITPEELETLPEGTELFSIHGVSYIVGTDKIDGDTRGGFLAFGFKK